MTTIKGKNGTYKAKGEQYGFSWAIIAVYKRVTFLRFFKRWKRVYEWHGKGFPITLLSLEEATPKKMNYWFKKAVKAYEERQEEIDNYEPKELNAYDDDDYSL